MNAESRHHVGWCTVRCIPRVWKHVIPDYFYRCLNPFLYPSVVFSFCREHEWLLQWYEMLEGFTRALRLWRRKSAYMSTIVHFPSFHNCRNTFYSYSKPLEGMGNVADSRNEGQQVSWNTHMSFKSMNGVIPDESHGYSELALPCPLFLPSPKWLHFKLNMRLFYAGLLKRQRGG